jgi:hypothetical protein
MIDASRIAETLIAPWMTPPGRQVLLPDCASGGAVLRAIK